MNRMFLAVAIPSFVALALAPACDLLAVQCANDRDCPDDVPYCVDDICVNSDEAERRGRDTSNGPGEGEGEGEGEEGCTAANEADACPGGLCYDVADGFAEQDTCIPDVETEDCADIAGTSAREELGPVIFDVVQTLLEGTCYTVDIAYFDREGDVAGTSTFGESGSNGSCCQTLFPSAVESNRLSFNVCLEGDATAGMFIRDNAGHQSNVICVHPLP